MKADTPVQTYMTPIKGSYGNTPFSLNRSHGDFVSGSVFYFLYSQPQQKEDDQRKQICQDLRAGSVPGEGTCAEGMARTPSGGATLHGHSNPKSIQLELSDPEPRQEQREQVLSPSALTTSLV